MIHEWRMLAGTEQETAILAQRLAVGLGAGDVIALRGDLGAGKSVFARALIKAIAGDEVALDVPSPTFSLVQTYDLDRMTVAHFDLFRLDSPQELEELGFDATDPCLVVIEWPEKAESEIPEERLDISLEQGDGETERVIVLAGNGAWAARLQRLETIVGFLEDAGWKDARQSFLTGDASARRYSRLTMDGKRAILMDTPAAPDTVVLRDGKSYKQLVHLAEDAVPFVAMTQMLRKHGYAAPEIYYMDVDQGLLLLEDLGDDRIVKGAPPQVSGERYLAATNLLVAMAEEDWGHIINVGDVFTYEIPRFDTEALLTEAQLVVEWFAPYFAGIPLTQDAYATFDSIWMHLLAYLDEDELRLTLRDLHSPNILWRGDRTGVQRLGLIDYQDAVLTHPIYDVVSLLQDARADMPATLEAELLNHYMNKIKNRPGYDEDRIWRAYAVLGAQRTSKLLGIFTRLAKRDGKPVYLSHLPRISRYLIRNLEHPALAPLRDWYEQWLPRALSPEQLERLAARSS